MTSSPTKTTTSSLGDITVLCRVRPSLDQDNTIQQVTSTTLQVDVCAETFCFDHVLGPMVSQEQVFEHSGAALVDCVLQGFNATVLVYGQTNAGKTFTMSGVEGNPGIIERFARRLFEQIRQGPEDSIEFSVRASYVEIYLEQVRDLLLDAGGGGNGKRLQIRESAELGIHIPQATTREVTKWEELVEVCDIAQRNRATSETLMNQVSSRSHSVLMLTVTQRLESGANKYSKVSLVDLAGSEQVKRTGAEGERLAEAQAINSSLSALGNVIHALTATPSNSSAPCFIPYRDSKLTRLLQESLGGNAKTWLIVNVSPDRANVQETLSTLRFGQRAKSIKNHAVINAVKSPKQLELELKRALETIAQQDRMLHALQQSGSELLLAPPQDVADMQALREQLAQVTLERDAAQLGWETAREGMLKLALECEAKQNEIDALLASQSRRKPNSYAERTAELRLEQLVAAHRQVLQRCAALEKIVNNRE